jgi:hypothetical protein
MRTRILLAFALIGLVVATDSWRVHASGPLGVYAIVEKVSFEPNETAPRRIKIVGPFSYVNGPSLMFDRPGREQSAGIGTSPAKRGYLYFRIPDDATAELTATIRREWADLKSVAGTGQAIGFGNWFYVGVFEKIQPEVKTTQIIENSPRGGYSSDMRVRPESEAPGTPVNYQSNNGVVKLSPDGSTNAAAVRALRTALGR